MIYLRSIFLVAVTVLLTAATSVAQITPLVVFPEAKVTAGSAAKLKVYFHNEDTTPSSLIIPAQLQLFIEENLAEPRTLSAFSSSWERHITLQPGQFSVQTYNISIPSDLKNVVTFKIAGFPGTLQTMVVKAPPLFRKEPGPENLAFEKQEEDHSIRDLESLYRAYSANFTAYEPTYFVIGADPSDTKFQLSFKYRLFNPSGSLSRKYPWISGFFMAYTQTSFWDLDAESLPFEDTSYKPELFYLSSNLKFRPTWLDAFFIQTSIQHESNGRGPDSSRSTNYFYVRPIFTLYNKASQLGMMISPKFLYYVDNDDKTNPDLADYRGYVDLEVRIGKAHSLMLTTSTRFAKKGTSFQADLTYPISRLLGNNFDIYLQLQYSNALAESLLHYQERTESLRLGIALVR